MTMKKLVSIIFIVFLCFESTAQNKQILFGFAEIPQTLMVNPGAETNFNYHIGVPGLSGVSLNFGASSGTISDLFLNDGASFTGKVGNLISKLTERDFISITSQIDVLNGGYRLDEKTYLSFGFYEELDFVGYFPKDIAELLYYGNAPAINKSVHFSQMKFRGEVLGVLHAGISRKMNSKLNLGARFKLYSGSINIHSANNAGTLTTIDGGDNIYRHHLSNVDAEIRTSGLYKEDDLNIGSKNVISNSFLSENIGVGLDFGFTYHHTPQIEFTGSILDLGFISYSKDVKSLTIKGDYTFDGIELLYDSNNTDYWSELDSDFKANVPRETNTDSYISWRPLKFNAAVKYSFGRARINKECYDVTYKEYYNNSIGLQLYSITRPLSNQIAATVFLEKGIGEKFSAKFTYTADDYSFSNLGIGMSAHFGLFHVYGMAGNVMRLSDIATANSASLQFGFNLIFD